MTIKKKLVTLQTDFNKHVYRLVMSWNSIFFFFSIFVCLLYIFVWPGHRPLVHSLFFLLQLQQQYELNINKWIQKQKTKNWMNFGLAVATRRSNRMCEQQQQNWCAHDRSRKVVHTCGRICHAQSVCAINDRRHSPVCVCQPSKPIMQPFNNDKLINSRHTHTRAALSYECMQYCTANNIKIKFLLNWMNYS